MSLYVTNPASSGSNTPGKSVTIQSAYFIDPVAGSDSNNGLTALTAFATWAHLQSAVFGYYTTLNVTPAGTPAICTITLLNNLPSSDPITFWNWVGPASTILVAGQAVVQKSGTFSATQTEDTTTNPATPGTVTDVGLDSTTSALQIQVLTGTGAGSRAMQMYATGGANTVQVFEWCTGYSTVGDAFSGIIYGTPPAPGDTYQIVDFTMARMGLGFLAYDQADGTVLFAGLAFQQVHFYDTATLYNVLNNNTFLDFGDCIFDDVVENSGLASPVAFVDCSLRSGINLAGGSSLGNVPTFFLFGGVVPVPGSGAVFNVFGMGGFFSDGNFSFAGDNTNRPGTVSQLTVSQGGSAVLGPTGFWNCGLTLLVEPYGFATAGLPTPIFGNSTYVQLYGDGNYAPVALEEQSGGLAIVSGNIESPTATVVLPTLACPNAPVGFGGAQFAFISGAGTAGVAWRFETASTGYSATSLLCTWANLDTAVTGFYTSTDPLTLVPGTNVRRGNAVRPDLMASVSWQAFTT